MGRLDRQTNRSKKKLNGYLGLSVLLLFLCVAVSSILLISRLGGFLYDATGAIPLIPAFVPDDSEYEAAASGQEQSLENSGTTDEAQQNTTEGSAADGEAAAGSVAGATPGTTSSAQSKPAKNPGFEASGGTQVWTTNTEIEIFRVFYENGEQEITVRSDNDEDKLLAPGTDNAYTFKLENTGNVALDYSVDIDAYFSPDYIRMPINCRLSRYDGTWIAGDLENYVDVPTLDTVEDQATLGAGKYTYYTLDWNWPFESGDDELDTLFGNLAVDHDLTLNIRITTTATESANPNAGGGISHPKTGDDSTLALWIALAVGSLFIILILIFMRDKDKKGDNNIEAKQ